MTHLKKNRSEATKIGAQRRRSSPRSGRNM